MTFRKTAAIVAALTVPFAAPAAFAHPGTAAHTHIMTTPIAGVRSNHWFDYRSDVEEAEIELKKDLDDAKTRQDRREAFQEYDRELADARHDYVKEAREEGLLRGRVIVGDGR